MIPAKTTLAERLHAFVDVWRAMSAAPPRRFHEQGLGSRTGLRIGSVRRDSQGNEDLDAFFAESKRVLDRMDASDTEQDTTASVSGASSGPERTVDGSFFDIDAYASPLDVRASRHRAARASSSMDIEEST